jgi:phage tail sheath gpL-like
MTIDQSAVASTFGLTTEHKDLRVGKAALLPQNVAVVGQGRSSVSYSLEKYRATSAGAVGARYGYGSPLHLAAKQLLPENGDGVGTVPVDICPLEDGYDSSPAAGSIAPTGTQTAKSRVRVLVNKIPSAWFIVPKDATAAAIVDLMVPAINGVLEMPVVATDDNTACDLESKWTGESANDIYVEVEAESLGITYTVTQPTGGAGNPSVAQVEAALAKFGVAWVTMVLNCLDVADTDVLDAIQEFGEGKWDPLVRKPFVAFVGNTEAVVATATTVSDARPTDRINAQLVAPGSLNLPFVVAARQLARIARVANNIPAKSYQKQQVTGITPGTDEEQWDYPVRDQAVKAGSSTVEVEDGLIKIADVVTFYKPTGENPPGYRYVVTIVKLQNCLFNFNQEFTKEEWASAALVADSDPTVSPIARRPKDWISKANEILQALGNEALIANVAAAQDATDASINGSNPNRIDLDVTFPVSGNANIQNMTQTFGFFYGAAA